MAMEIRVNGSACQTGYEERLQAGREEAAKAENSRNGEKAAKTGTAQKEEQASNNRLAPRDEYISSEQSGEKPNGLYRVGQDENGNRKIFFNDPKRADRLDGNGQPEKALDGSEDGDKKAPRVNGQNPDNGEEKCVGNTDKVDREIRELKEKKKKLEQQIKEASGDEKKTKELENKLAQVERELSQKDNDTYRRQHSEFTEQ